MDKLIGLVSSPQQSASPMVAAQALNRAAQKRGASLAVETRSALGVQHPLNAAQIDAAQAVLIAADADERIDETPFAGKTIHRVSLDDAIREADAVLARVAANVASNTAQGGGNAHAAQGPQASPRALKIVAITSCPTGIAHTFMAAEGLAQGAKSLGHEIHVETQGSVGAQNTLSDEQIAAADLVVIAADTQVDKSRFRGKPIYETGTKGAIGKGAALIERAIAEASVDGNAPASQASASANGQSAAGGALADQVAAAKKQRSAKASGPYRHLMTGVSFMLPFV